MDFENELMSEIKKEVKHSIIKGKKSKLDEYAAQEDARLIKELSEKIEEEKKEKENKLLEEKNQKLKELHYMKCPKCGMDLQEIEFIGVQIDLCEECKGVWLDHGELETIILKESGFLAKLSSKIGLKNLSPSAKKK